MPHEKFRKRKGQTAVEYILITLALFLVFVIMYRALQWAVRDTFTRGAGVILKTYVATY